MPTKPTDPKELVETMNRGIRAVKEGDMPLALTILSNVYMDGFDKLTTDGVSYYGLAVAIVRQKYKEAIETCKHAIRIQPTNPHNFVNLAKIYTEAGNRKKAIDTLEEGLSRNGRSRILLSYWKTLGMRQRPVLPFLSRDNPLNVKLGKTRKAKEPEKKQIAKT